MYDRYQIKVKAKSPMIVRNGGENLTPNRYPLTHPLLDLVQTIRIRSTTSFPTITSTRHPAHLTDQTGARAIAQLITTSTFPSVLSSKVLEARTLCSALFIRHVVRRDVLASKGTTADFLDTPKFGETVRGGGDRSSGGGVFIQLQCVRSAAEGCRVTGTGHVALARYEREGTAVGELVAAITLGGVSAG